MSLGRGKKAASRLNRSNPPLDGAVMNPDKGGGSAGVAVDAGQIDVAAEKQKFKRQLL